MSFSSLNVVLLGFPGSGKSTQAGLLSQSLNLTHVDVGSCLRRAAQEDSVFGSELNEMIHHKKELVSDEVVACVLEEEFKRVPERTGIILDGAPRRSSQVPLIEALFEKFGRRLERVILLTLPEEESINRIAYRRFCAQCCRAWIVEAEMTENTPRCPECGTELTQRKDDTSEGVRKRLEVFARETLPVVEYYRANRRLLEVSANCSIEQSYESIVRGLGLKV
jgi:adenylate kinase